MYYPCKFCGTWEHVEALYPKKPEYYPKGSGIATVCLKTGVEDSSNFLFLVFSIIMKVIYITRGTALGSREI